MSKFHKTLKNHFEIGKNYTIKRIIDLEPIQTEYIGFEKGHLLFKSKVINCVSKTFIPHINDKAFAARPENTKDFKLVIGINGGDIRDENVVITTESMLFTVNGWKDL